MTDSADRLQRALCITALIVAGVLIDRSPGLEGHQHFFLFLAAFALLGLIASFTLHRRVSSSTPASEYG